MRRELRPLLFNVYALPNIQCRRAAEKSRMFKLN